jgi:hypothetical protein
VGLFDGHNGDYASKFVSRLMPEVLEKSLKESEFTIDAIKEVHASFFRGTGPGTRSCTSKEGKGAAHIFFLGKL